jgi:hypothetical protein
MSDAESDALTIMRAVAFRKYRPNIPIFAQVILPRSTYHITGLVDHVLCIDEFKLGMIVIFKITLGSEYAKPWVLYVSLFNDYIYIFKY